ncbi:acetoin utilization AcuB family protein [Mesobacillus foraminis]|uniref:Acetoin utilization protein AcuB n=1 Tax=Mesobacillus foraminis TaxID=279826 RepID=A0A4R2BBV8_9BACI|nr:acetoin utilization AcuB family protein [Mesobacillus foraminis]MBT2754424.1 acetoin utilization AcuB family protein [Mesobacillus foraminis]TCN24407.1 acetoin utilization protein AcuB [Mesobacillus foraminis]
MIVEEIMIKQVTTLTADHTIADAMKLLEDKKIRHLPIVDRENHIVGLVTDRDIRDAAPSIFRSDLHREDLENPIRNLMKTNLITCHPLDFVEEIAALFYEHHIGCLPVVNHGKLVGIITETDLLHTLVALTGAHQPGSHIEIKVPNKSGMLNEAAAIISGRKANISSVLVYPDPRDDSFKILVFRVQTMNPAGIIEDLKNSGFNILWPNLPGGSS